MGSSSICNNQIHIQEHHAAATGADCGHAASSVDKKDPQYELVITIDENEAEAIINAAPPMDDIWKDPEIKEDVSDAWKGNYKTYAATILFERTYCTLYLKCS